MTTTRLPEDSARLDRLLAKANAAAGASQLERAADLYRECLSLAPNEPRSELGLGTALLRLERFDEAMPCLDKALQHSWDVGTLLRVSRLLINYAQWSVADRVLKQVVEASPDCAPAFCLLGELAYLRDAPDEAQTLFKVALELQPADIGILYQYIKDADPEEALRAIRTTLAHVAGDSGKKTELLATLAVYTEHKERKAHGLPVRWSADRTDLDMRFSQPELANYREAARAWSRDQPDNGKALRHQGVASLALGEIAEAERCFARLREMGGAPYTMTFAPDFYARLEAMTPADIVRGLPEIVAVTPALQPRGPVFFLSCDFNYLRDYGEPFLRSIDDVAHGADVHVHVMNAGPDQLASFRTWTERLSNVSLAISAETVVLAKPEDGRLYYHAVRFIRFYRYLEEYGQPICMMDVDTLMHRDLREALEDLGRYDVAFPVQPWCLDPALRYVALVVAMTAAPRALAYAKLVAAFIADAYRKNRLSWGIDQLALHNCFIHMARMQTAPALHPASAKIVDEEATEAGFLWVAPGKIKRILRLYADGNFPDGEIRRSRYVTAFRKYST